MYRSVYGNPLLYFDFGFLSDALSNYFLF